VGSDNRIVELRVVKDGDQYKFMNLEFDPSGKITYYEPSYIEIPVGVFPNKQGYIDYFNECVTAINAQILDIDDVLKEYLTAQASGITWQDVFDGTLVAWANPQELADFVLKAGYHYTSWTNDYIYYVDENANYYQLDLTVQDL